MSRKSNAILMMALLLIISTATIAFVILSAKPPSITLSEISQTGTKGLAFIENVLPIDTSQYNITLQKPLSISSTNSTETSEDTYSLESEKSTLRVICHFDNKVLRFCFISVRYGSVILESPYNNTNDSAIGFLMRYQNYTNIDSTELINMLRNIESAKNMVLASGTLSLTIKNGEFPAGTKTTSFSWMYVYDDCEYTGLNLNFDNGTFAGFSDTRGLYKIGNTTVNGSMKQAVDIAKERIKNYTYAMPGGVWIGNFNVSGSSAELLSGVREPYILPPFWQVRLFLDKQYPGSVTNLLVLVWADTGEVYLCYHDSTGHKDY